MSAATLDRFLDALTDVELVAEFLDIPDDPHDLAQLEVAVTRLDLSLHNLAARIRAAKVNNHPVKFPPSTPRPAPKPQPKPPPKNDPPPRKGR